ncbi:peroxin 24 [Magnaporthiopsis poae ATCC 64411]|uniref:Peroxin 24 n=1 Tax=Magnaporthiopsis poae (strain ATCC 64411 / 73-15) TaxID=644358 RepID=A0A0C4DZC9_MAGP6|nr:peroxin 24 [Magnaporthiopsis poae ATCC 64411]
MDEYSPGILIHTEEPGTPGAAGSDDRSCQASEAGDGAGTSSDKKRRSLRGLLKGGANMQDKLLEKCATLRGPCPSRVEPAS